MKCPVCPHHCELSEGVRGYCRARTVSDGKIVSLNYGMLTGLALDPIEKKPLARFHPGSRILSLGSWGCNMRCPWCQNDAISRGEIPARRFTSDEIINEALALRPQGNIGVAFTYNEPTISSEFVLDTSRKAQAAGLKTVIVTNGMTAPDVWDDLLQHIDALNIDLKTIREDRYAEIGGDLSVILRNIAAASERAHTEVTTLIVPGFNDDEDGMRELARTLSAINPEIPLHVTRFFPAGEMRGTPPTPIPTVRRFAEIAREYLKWVYIGNC